MRKSFIKIAKSSGFEDEEYKPCSREMLRLLSLGQGWEMMFRVLPELD
jgi:hypothetical protein